MCKGLREAAVGFKRGNNIVLHDHLDIPHSSVSFLLSSFTFNCSNVCEGYIIDLNRTKVLTLLWT